jgi:uncharacterized protein (TIGR02646 family)
MRFIQKGREPKSLEEYRLSGDVNKSFNNSNKNDIQDALLKEQKCLCCYCMARISKSTMKIEHYKAQEKYPTIRHTLDFSNMLGACKGKYGEETTCDTRRGIKKPGFETNKDLKVNPLDATTIRKIKYLKDGTIFSEDPEINQDLEKYLNLNIQVLKDNRRKYYEIVKGKMMEEKRKGTWDKRFCEKIRNFIVCQCSPFHSMALYFIEQKIS